MVYCTFGDGTIPVCSEETLNNLYTQHMLITHCGRFSGQHS